MGFGAKTETMGVDARRLAAIAGKPLPEEPVADTPTQPVKTVAAVVRPVSLEPDQSRIRKCSIDETPVQRKKRLAAKTVNFSTTIIARIIILAGVSYYAWSEANGIGGVHRGIVIGIFVMLADLGRVIVKALDPGTK